MDSRRNQAPDRWLGCPPFGELIDDLFLPMKTLLNENVPLPPMYSFTPDLFVKETKGKKLNVGLVINLTFSNRYYEPSDLDDHNIEFRQIACRGHDEAPQPRERKEFIDTCNAFISKNPKKLIAVHCTHGFNRTGFMICYYLCSERDWSLDAAISVFALKRPPGIYKQDYLNELASTYGDGEDCDFTAPPRPNWDSDEGQLANLHSDDPLRVSHQNQTEFYEGITDVLLVRDEALRARIYRHCCTLCKFNANPSNVVFPGAQPVSMDQNNIHQLKTQRYRVSWKADGCRYMMYIQDADNIFFLTRSLQLWRVIGLKFPRLDDLNSHLTDTLLDGEMVTDDYKGQKIPKYLIYDVISLDGKIVADQNFDKRCGHIKCVIVGARHRAKFANLIHSEDEPFKIGDKGFFYIQDSKKTLELQVTHETDGLIYQPVDSPYTGGTCAGILKWKPPELNSIDFKLVIREERQNGCIPEKFAYLHVSNRADAITKFKLDREQLSSYKDYDNKIVEMTLVNKKWVILKERTDKLYANSYETASAVFRSIQYPITEKFLLDYIKTIPPEPKK